jgi:hypothetical protein
MKRVSILIDEAIERFLEAEIPDTGQPLDERVSRLLKEISSAYWLPRECDCGGLELAASDPQIPVEFESETNEYAIVARTDTHTSRTTIRYCFHCGGAAPPSRRHELFERVDQREAARISSLFIGIETLEQAIATFGAPDQDIPRGIIKTYIDHPEIEPEVARSIVYSNLSEVADVRLSTGSNGKLQIGITGKAKKPSSP